MGSISMKKYQDGEIILNPGDHPRTLFKVLSGAITMYANYGQPGQHLVGSYSPPSALAKPLFWQTMPVPTPFLPRDGRF